MLISLHFINQMGFSMGSGVFLVNLDLLDVGQSF